MQDQNFSMLESNLAQCLMNRRSIFIRKRGILGLLKVFELTLLGPLPGNVAADAIHRDSMRNAIQPRPQRTGVFQFANAAKDLDPYLLQHIERAVCIARQTGCVVKQWPLHHRNQILEGPRLAALAAQRQPLVLRSSFALRRHSVLYLHPLSKSMSKETR